LDFSYVEGKFKMKMTFISFLSLKSWKNQNQHSVFHLATTIPSLLKKFVDSSSHGCRT